MTSWTASAFRNRIEDHFEAADMDVVCRKRKSGYAVYWSDDRLPLAKLRPTGRDDEVEVYQWTDDRWQRITDSGLTLGLDEALEFITDDPDGLFFESDPHTWEDGDEPAEFSEARRELAAMFLFCGVVGGAVGGGFSSPLTGGAVGVATSVLFAVVRELFNGNWKTAIAVQVFCGLPGAVLAGTSAVLGASLHQGVGSGFWGAACGISVGAMSAIIMLTGRPLAWGLGLAAGTLLGLQVVESSGLSNQVLCYGLVAVVASVSASLLTFLQSTFRRLGLFLPRPREET
jgi:hypothetical protein